MEPIYFLALVFAIGVLLIVWSLGTTWTARYEAAKKVTAEDRPAVRDEVEVTPTTT